MRTVCFPKALVCDEYFLLRHPSDKWEFTSVETQTFLRHRPVDRFSNFIAQESTVVFISYYYCSIRPAPLDKWRGIRVTASTLRFPYGLWSKLWKNLNGYQLLVLTIVLPHTHWLRPRDECACSSVLFVMSQAVNILQSLLYFWIVWRVVSIPLGPMEGNVAWKRSIALFYS